MAENNLRVNILANVKNFEAAMMKASSRLNAFGKKTAEVGKNLSMGLTAPLTILGGVALNQTVNFEKLRTTLDVLTGSAEAGASAFERLVQFSATTPFQLPDLVRANNTLMGFGLTADQAFESLKSMGDIAAVAGGDLDRIAVAFGQSAAAGRVMNQDLLQFINNGVPILELLANTMGVTTGEVKQLSSEGKVTFDVLQQAFIDATSEGGKFEGGMKTLSKTLGGTFSTLKDNVNIALADFGTAIVDAFNLSENIPKLTAFVGDLSEKFKNLSPEIRRTIIIFAALLTGIGPLLIIVGKLSIGIGAVAKGLPFVVKGFKALNLAMRANPIIAVASALLLVAGAFIKIGKARREAKLNDLRSDMEALSDTEAAQSLEDLNKQLDEENKKLLAANDKRGRGRQKAQELSKRVITDLKTRIDLLTDVIEKRKELNETIQPDPILTGDSGIDDAPIRSAVKSVNELAESTSNAESKFAKLGKQSQITGTILTQTIEPLKEKTTQFANAMTFLGQEIMNAIANAFESMMNGEPFFKTLGKSILGLIKKLVAAATAALVLSTLLGGIGVGKIGMTVSSFKGIFGALTGFAKGGLVTGPTLGLVGEGIGTNRGNPEVIAPLDRLQNMIQPKTQRVEVGGQFSINGQDLVLVLQRANSDRSRLL